jgi:5-methylcytosine-specific restriction protein A
MHKNWNEEELKAAVEAYLDMWEKHKTGISFTKKMYYEELAAKFGRTQKAYEYRMQNISHVFSLMGRPWIPGLLPARNVGPRTEKLLETLIIQIETETST